MGIAGEISIGRPGFIFTITLVFDPRDPTDPFNGEPESFSRPLGVPSLRAIRKLSDRVAITQALERHHGGRTAAARDLGITREGLYKLMERLGIDVPVRRPDGTTRDHRPGSFPIASRGTRSASSPSKKTRRSRGTDRKEGPA